MDTADTAAPYEDCGILPGIRTWFYSGISLDRCYIPVGAIIALPYKEASVETTQADPSIPVMATPEATPAVEQSEVVEVKAPATTEQIGVTADDITKITQQTGGDSTLAIVLALIAVIGGAGMIKFYQKWSEQRHEQAMKRLDIEAGQAGLNGAQPPPCQVKQAEIDAKLTSIESRLVKAERMSVSMPDDFDPEDLQKKVDRIEKTLKASKAKAGTK
jgi:uncharacterized protein HemX